MVWLRFTFRFDLVKNCLDLVFCKEHGKGYKYRCSYYWWLIWSPTCSFVSLPWKWPWIWKLMLLGSHVDTNSCISFVVLLCTNESSKITKLIPIYFKMDIKVDDIFCELSFIEELFCCNKHFTWLLLNTYWALDLFEIK